MDTFKDEAEYLIEQGWWRLGTRATVCTGIICTLCASADYEETRDSQVEPVGRTEHGKSMDIRVFLGVVESAEDLTSWKQATGEHTVQ